MLYQLKCGMKFRRFVSHGKSISLFRCLRVVAIYPTARLADLYRRNNVVSSESLMVCIDQAFQMLDNRDDVRAVSEELLALKRKVWVP